MPRPPAQGPSHRGAAASAATACSCLLTALIEARLSGVAPGLMAGDGGLDLDLTLLSCCGGSGQFWSEASRRGLEAVQICDLQPRIRMLGDLLREFFQRPLVPTSSHASGQDQASEIKSILNPDGKRFSSALARLKAVAQGEQQRGMLFGGMHAQDNRRNELLLMSVAVAAIWRFGLKVHWLDLRQPGTLLIETPKAAVKRRTLLCAVGVGRLWDPNRREALQIALRLAEQAGWPLWLCLEADSTATKPGASPAALGTKVGRHVGKALAARVAALRGLDPWQQIAPSDFASLQRHCEVEPQP